MADAASVSFFTGMGELVAGAGIPLLLSLVASGVRMLKTGWRGWRRGGSNLALSIFCGQVVWWGLDYCQDLPTTVKAAATLFAAFSATWLLDTLAYRLRKDIREGGHIPHHHRHHDEGGEF